MSTSNLKPVGGLPLPKGPKVLPTGKQSVTLARGETYAMTGPLNITADGVTIAAADGPGPLPKLHWPAGVGLSAKGRKNITLRNIELIADRPTERGIYLYGSSNVLIDGCRISGFTFGITAENCKSVTITNSTIVDNYNPSGRGAGIYADTTDGLTITNNVLDKNGWNENFPHIPAPDQSQGIYATGHCDHLTATGNFISRSSGCGLQARCGGDVWGNLFVDNPIHLTHGVVNGGGPVKPLGAVGEVRGNVMIGTRPTGTDPRGIAMMLGNSRKVMVSGNVIAHGGAGIWQAIQVLPCLLESGNVYVKAGTPDGKPVGIVDLTIIGNMIHDWPRGNYLRDPRLVDAAKAPPNTPDNLKIQKLTVQTDWKPRREANLRDVMGPNVIDRMRARQDKIGEDVKVLIAALS